MKDSGPKARARTTAFTPYLAALRPSEYTCWICFHLPLVLVIEGEVKPSNSVSWNLSASLRGAYSLEDLPLSTMRLLNSPAMRGLRRPAPCRPLRVAIRQQRRFASANTGSADAASFWTTQKVLLLSAFTGSLAYAYGVWDAGSSYKQDGAKIPQLPAYANRADLEKVSLMIV